MPEIPIKTSIVVSTAESIKMSILSGEWRTFLPGERQLSLDLQVGRSTLRKAMDLLRREGWVHVTHGKQTRIAKRSRLRGLKRPSVVAALVKGNPEDIDPLLTMRLLHLQHDLHNVGFSLETFFVGDFVQGASTDYLEKLLLTCNAACWVIFAGNHRIQSLFNQRPVDAFLVGSPHPGIALPHLDIDFRAACRHAAGYLLSRGHRQIDLVTRDVAFPGALASIEGFEEAFRVGTPGARPRVVRVSNHSFRVGQPLARKLFGKHRASAIIGIGPQLSLALFTAAMAVGLRVPADISLVSRDARSFLQSCVPTMTTYDINHAVFRKKLTNCVIELSTTGRISTPANLVMPELCPGESVADFPGRQGAKLVSI